MTEVKFTNEIYQNELSPNDLEYDFNKHQPYYEFELNGEKCYIGLDKILECVAIAEKIGEIPKIGISFWQNVLEKFNVNFFEININENISENISVQRLS